MNNSGTWTKVIAFVLALSLIFVLAAAVSTDITFDSISFLRGGWDYDVNGTHYAKENRSKENVKDKKKTRKKAKKKDPAAGIDYALNLYSNAANGVKTESGVKATRKKTVVTPLKGTIPSMYQAFGLREGTNTERVTYTGAAIDRHFPVKKCDYACALKASDIKEATIAKSGTNKIVTLTIKNDDPDSFSRSSKCINTPNCPLGHWNCKGVMIRATIDKDGNLLALFTKAPVYVTSGANSFSFLMEEYWSID